MLGVSYADMFTGALCFMGTNFYTATFDAKKEVYPPRYLPNQGIPGHGQAGLPLRVSDG